MKRIICKAAFLILVAFVNIAIMFINTTPVNAEPLYMMGFINEDTYVKDKKSMDSENIDFLITNKKIYYTKVDDSWGKLPNGGYIKLDSISDEKVSWSYQVPEYSGKKSWMGYNLFGNGTNQYTLQQMAETDENGLRKVDGRYCVAVGSHFRTSIGQKFDLILENNVVIPCVMGDQKADCHTDASNIFTQNGCCSEFLVDSKVLNNSAKTSGDISSINNSWDSPVALVIVYDENILN